MLVKPIQFGSIDFNYQFFYGVFNQLILVFFFVSLVFFLYKFFVFLI